MVSLNYSISVVVFRYWSHHRSTQKISPGYHVFLVTAYWLFVPAKVVLKQYITCPTTSKRQPYNNENCLSKHAGTHKIDADNQLYTFVCTL